MVVDQILLWEGAIRGTVTVEPHAVTVRCGATGLDAAAMQAWLRAIKVVSAEPLPFGTAADITLAPTAGAAGSPTTCRVHVLVRHESLLQPPQGHGAVDYMLGGPPVRVAQGLRVALGEQRVLSSPAFLKVQVVGGWTGLEWLGVKGDQDMAVRDDKIVDVHFSHRTVAKIVRKASEPWALVVQMVRCTEVQVGPPCDPAHCSAAPPPPHKTPHIPPPPQHTPPHTPPPHSPPPTYPSSM